MSDEQIQQAPVKRGRGRPRTRPGDGPITTQPPAVPAPALSEEEIEARAMALAEQIVAQREADAMPEPALPPTVRAKVSPAGGALPGKAQGSSSIAEAMRKVKLRNSQAMAAEARINSDPELRALKRAGMQVLPPTTARPRNRTVDPTVIKDGNGEPVGKPGYKIRAVPKINMFGQDEKHAGGSEINLHKQEGWVPVRYEHDDPEGRFKAGDVVEDHFGVRMQMDPDTFAEYWASKHPAGGLDAKAYHDAMVQDLIEKHQGSVTIQNRGQAAGVALGGSVHEEHFRPRVTE